LRSGRYSMLVKDGVLTHLNDEKGGGYEVSDAQTLLKQAQG
jgi:glutaredoxin/glutathione-dependent peroxiredoxin